MKYSIIFMLGIRNELPDLCPKALRYVQPAFQTPFARSTQHSDSHPCATLWQFLHTFWTLSHIQFKAQLTQRTLNMGASKQQRNRRDATTHHRNAPTDKTNKKTPPGKGQTNKKDSHRDPTGKDQQKKLRLELMTLAHFFQKPRAPKLMETRKPKWSLQAPPQKKHEKSSPRKKQKPKVGPLSILWKETDFLRKGCPKK